MRVQSYPWGHRIIQELLKKIRSTFTFSFVKSVLLCMLIYFMKSHGYLYLVSRRLYISLYTSAPAQRIRLKFRNYWSEWSKNWCAHVYLLSSLVSYFSWPFLCMICSCYVALVNSFLSEQIHTLPSSFLLQTVCFTVQSTYLLMPHWPNCSSNLPVVLF